jgi:hypothetical protein
VTGFVGFRIVHRDKARHDHRLGLLTALDQPPLNQ